MPLVTFQEGVVGGVDEVVCEGAGHVLVHLLVLWRDDLVVLSPNKAGQRG